MVSKKKLLENYLKRMIRTEIKRLNENDELDLDLPYWVIATGGSIGDQGRGTTYIGGGIRGQIYKTFDDVDEAKDYAKRMRSYLSKGEKSYYKMGYKVVPANKKFIR